MKAELKALLDSKEGTLQLNSLFTLRRWTLDPETDILGRSGEYLALEIQNRYKAQRTIESRTTKGIMEEVTKYMPEMMDEYRDELVRRFNGGELHRFL